MNVEEGLKFAENFLERGSLNKIQEIVFRQSWEEQAYQAIAKNSGYELGYVRDVGCKLWHSLSQAFGKKVTKHNFRQVLLQQYRETHYAQHKFEDLSKSVQPRLQLPDAAANKVTSTANLANRYQDWGEAIDVSVFFGRATELALLSQWSLQEQCRLLTVLGMGGIGKTALVAKLTQQVPHNFNYLIWRSLRNAPAIEDLLKDLISFFSHQQGDNLPETLDELISCLIGYLRQHHCLIVLDNGESILRQGEMAGHYCPNYERYGQLLRRVGDEPHQSCLILTSREQPIGLAAKAGKNLPVRSLQLSGLPPAAAREILIAKGLTLSEDEAHRLTEYYAGNPLTLKVAATTIQSLFNGDVTKFLAEGTLVFGEIWQLLEQQFSRLSGVEQQVMYQLANYREQVSLSQLLKDIEATLSQRQLLEALESLHRRSLLQQDYAGFVQQPVIAKYVTELVKNTAPQPG